MDRFPLWRHLFQKFVASMDSEKDAFAQKRGRDLDYGGDEGEQHEQRGKGSRILPPRAPSNPLLAEALRQARQRQSTAAFAQSGGSYKSGGTYAGRPSEVEAITWREDAEELVRLEKDSKDAEALNETDLEAFPADIKSTPGKQKHIPIVWQATGSAAERALAEVAAFQMQPEASNYKVSGSPDKDMGLGLVKPSPTLSSDLEDIHIMREGTESRLPFDSQQDRPTYQIDSGGAEVTLGTNAVTEDNALAIAQNTFESQYASQGTKRSVPNMLRECRNVDLYEKLNRISEGTYGVVYRARKKETAEICALKKVKLDKERDGFPLTSIREINILLSLQHPNIVNVEEVVVGSSLDAVFLVMEYADHDLKSVMDSRMSQPFSIAEVKCLMFQLLAGVAYLHENWVLHRDLKTSNILYTNRGDLKICDFGLARHYGSPLKAYTHMVVTLWYRAPELLLGMKTYSTAVDIWSVGCIMGELLLKEPLFPGKGELEQIDRIFRLLGAPTEDSWPGLNTLPGVQKLAFQQGKGSGLRARFPQAGRVFDNRPILSDPGLDLLSRLLALCPENRITASEALSHPWFQEQPLAKEVALMPTFLATNENLHGQHH